MEKNIKKSSSRIKALSAVEAQKIAAGEVVERPANVVKELIENALDAGSTAISIFINDGGKETIRVVDNGMGMSLEDAHACFKQHATSKITTIDDLTNLTTFGFRGEALSSISSVSKIELVTRETHALHGHSIIKQADVLIKSDIIACPVGTDITVNSIFYNVPARRKFLKARETEWRQILLLTQAFCLAYQSVHFKLYSQEKLILNCPATHSTQERLKQIYDTGLSNNMLSVQASTQGSSLNGCISNHHHVRYDRTSIFIFVNRRWVKNQKLIRALLKGYLNVLPAGRFPAACLFLEMEPKEVDINIHPRKEEVLFLHPLRIESLITNTVKETLEQGLSAQLNKKIQFISPDRSSYFPPQEPFTPYNNFDFLTPIPSSKVTTPDNIDTHYAQHPPNKDFSKTDSMAPLSVAERSYNEPPQENQQSLLKSPDILAPQEEEALYTLIGQSKNTYIIIEKDDGIMLIDQHAAHERILYEQCKKSFVTAVPVALMFPEIITLSAEDILLLHNHFDIFLSNGIQIAPFGNNQLIIDAVPVYIKNISLNELVRQTIGWIKELGNLDPQDFTKMVHEKLHAQIACKAAVKAGDVLTSDQMHELLKDLNKTNNRFSCPHGRPTGWLMSYHEIEKKFKRKS